MRIPSVTTAKSQTKDFGYVKGWNSNASNDDLDRDQWRLVQDAREVKIGKWKTRLGADLLSVPIGEAVNVQQASTTGAGNFSFNTSTWWAKKVVATATGPLTSIEVRTDNPSSAATGTIVLGVYSDSSGAPGTELVRTTIASAEVGTSYAYEKARSITCPTITNGSTYWVVGYVQEGGSGSYRISTTTNASTGLTSTNSGVTWAAASLDFNVKLSTATSGGVKGVRRVLRSNGSRATVLAHGSTVYSVNEGTGATSSIDTGLNASSTDVIFEFVNDVLYYTDGLGKPRKYDFSSASEVATAPEAASNVIEHKGILFYKSAVDPTKVFYTNFAEYDTFTSTDFLYVPAPKTGDPVNAFAKLNGQLFFITRNNKHVLYGAENATFRLDEAIGQKGTFSQKSVAFDQNYIFLASDDGIYQFNGAEERNIAKDILTSWTSLLDKDSTVLELHDNRLYVWYTPNGGSANSECFVYNVQYGIWESLDTRAYVGRSHARFDPDDYFILGSNRAGFLMLAESSTNDFTVMGEPLSYELRTRYEHFDTPAQLKRAPMFRPHLDTVSGTYSIDVGYDVDFADDPTYTQLGLQGSGVRFDTGETYDSGVTFGAPGQVNPLDSAPAIPGEWRRLQLRYRHEAAREPVEFDGHVLSIETQRLI